MTQPNCEKVNSAEIKVSFSESFIQSNENFKKYKVGLATNDKGKEYPFLIKAGKNVPKFTFCNYVIDLKVIEACELQHNIFYLHEYIQKLKMKDIQPIINTKLSFSDIVAISDSQGVHFGLVMEIGLEESKILMLTSNSNWHRNARLLNKQEESMFGLQFSKSTFFAPCIIANENLYLKGKYPEDESSRLLEEFKNKLWL